MNFFKTAILATGLFLILSCRNEPFQISVIQGKRIAIDTEIVADSTITEFIAPYRRHLNATLDSALAYNPEDLSKDDGELNTAIGNLMADILMEQANPVFEKRTGNEIDMVLLNHGGIRATLNKGKITSRSAYALMPFENEIVVAALKGSKIIEMLDYLEKAGVAHPVSGINIKMNRNYKITEAAINGKPVDTAATYFVATTDYLQQGGDNMNFFLNPLKLYHTNYKLRNAIIDYFVKVDTLQATADHRFIRMQ